ncbi:MAG: hypothetical protein ACYTGW_14955 [Planctomycetota bacterium]|jgi:hypothetical protein
MNRPRGTQVFLTTLLGGCLACGLAAQAKQASRVMLAFDPPSNKVLEVKYQEDQSWVYSEESRGKLRTELVLRWAFEAAEKPGLIQATGTFESVVYCGSGTKNGKAWDHDVQWTRKDGYLKGKDSEAVNTWIRREIKEGVRFTLDKRGAANPGVC